MLIKENNLDSESWARKLNESEDHAIYLTINENKYRYITSGSYKECVNIYDTIRGLNYKSICCIVNKKYELNEQYYSEIKNSKLKGYEYFMSLNDKKTYLLCENAPYDYDKMLDRVEEDLILNKPSHSFVEPLFWKENEKVMNIEKIKHIIKSNKIDFVADQFSKDDSRSFAPEDNCIVLIATNKIDGASKYVSYVENCGEICNEKIEIINLNQKNEIKNHMEKILSDFNFNEKTIKYIENKVHINIDKSYESKFTSEHNNIFSSNHGNNLWEDNNRLMDVQNKVEKGKNINQTTKERTIT